MALLFQPVWRYRHKQWKQYYYLYSGNACTSGAYLTTFTTTAATNVTLPTTGTLATLAGAETFTNKTLTSPVINTPTISGGTIDNTPIGSTTASTGAFTKLTTTSDAVIHGLTVGLGSGAITSNSAIGNRALHSNTTGTYNTVNGYNALYSNTTGSDNIALGIDALYNNTTGIRNIAIGVSALEATTSGFTGMDPGGVLSYNTAIGYMALKNNLTGNYNTAIGYQADVSSDPLTNATAIGYFAVVNASNKVVIGNSSVTTIGGYAIWSNYSDRRLKENIVHKNDLGLNFINKLQTVSYNYRTDPSKRRRDGLIAQDVEKALNDLGLQFSGLVIDDDKDKTMNLSYGDFVIPLINAVQEQQKTIENVEKENATLKEEVAAMKKEMDEIKAMVKK